MGKIQGSILCDRGLAVVVFRVHVRAQVYAVAPAGFCFPDIEDIVVPCFFAVRKGPLCGEVYALSIRCKKGIGGLELDGLRSLPEAVLFFQ